MQLGGVPVQTASMGSIPERGLVRGGGVIGRRRPESCRGDLAHTMLAAVLIEIVGEPVYRPFDAVGLPRMPLLTIILGGWHGRAGPGRPGRMRVSGPGVPLQGAAA